MEDIFELMERDEARIKQNRKMIEALERNHSSNNTILKSTRDQWVLHQFLVEKRTVVEIASELELSKQRVQQIINRATHWMNYYLVKEESNAMATRGWNVEPVVLKELGYDVYEVMVEPDEARVEEVTRMLSAPLDNLEFTVRTYNCLMAAKIERLGDLFKLESARSLLKYRNFGMKSMVELEDVLIKKGLKFRVAPITNFQATEAEIKLPLSYPVSNFVWSNEIQQVFNELNIITVKALLSAHKLLIEKELAAEHFEFIERRINEWGLKWK